MALILEPTSWKRPRLLEMLKDQREGLEGTLQNLEGWPYPVRDPASFQTARDLLVDAIALGDGLDAGRASPELLARVVNVQYDAMISAIDLMKSHSDVPSRVPRARK